jgi:hypothetical protein
VTGAPTNDMVALDLRGHPMKVTLADGEAIKAALLVRLKKSDLADRDALIKMTENAPVLIDSGILRVGAWLLQAQDDALRLTYRGPFGPAMAEIYRAEIAKRGGALGREGRHCRASAREAVTGRGVHIPRRDPRWEQTT